mgnify:CR=1 FL=1
MDKRILKIIATIKAFIQKHLTEERKAILLALTISLGSAYAAATLVVTVATPIIVSRIMAIPVMPRVSNNVAPTLRDRPNYRTLQKDILARNIFNAEGTYPKEEDQEQGQAEPQAFADVNAPCTPSKLPLTLVGTIVLGDASLSMCTIKEKEVDEVDVYRIGDRLISNDKISIHDILRNKVIFNNNGHRECVEVELVPPERRDVAYDTSLKTAKPDNSVIENPVVYLQASWVQSELGDGFEKVINSSRLVPNALDDGKINGYKIFSIRKGSLYDKVGLQDGDVVTKVNETVIDIEHGFALHQAFLDDWDISIQVLRQGKTPLTLKVSVKK